MSSLAGQPKKTTVLGANAVGSLRAPLARRASATPSSNSATRGKSKRTPSLVADLTASSGGKGLSKRELLMVVTQLSIMLLVTMVVLAGMVFFVLPQFAGIFKSSNAEVPFITKIRLDGGQFARSYWWVILGTGAGSVYGLFAYSRTKTGRSQLDRLLMKLPYIKGVCAALFAGRLFRLQGAMLESGVTMMDVLELSKASCGNACYTQMIHEIEESVVNGNGFSDVLRDNPLIPGAAADMVSTGEANGQLGPVLQTVGEFYETEGEEKLRDAVKIAEPVIINEIAPSTIKVNVVTPARKQLLFNGVAESDPRATSFVNSLQASGQFEEVALLSITGSEDRPERSFSIRCEQKQ